MDPVDDKRFYKFGVFYYNPDDERAIVPKRVRPFGFQVNFARRESVWSIIAIVLVTIILAELSESLIQ